VELNTTLRLGGSFELGALVTVEKVTELPIEATLVKIKVITQPDFELNQVFTGYVKQYLSKVFQK
jgi:hypothetical protein